MPNKGWIFAILGLLLCWFFPGETLAGGARYSIETWTTKNGLPRNSVISMIQTRDGYLWLGTQSGLARFDGVSFTNFDEVNTPGLKSSRIVRLFEDSKSNLWIGTETAGVALARDGRIMSVNLGNGSREGRVTSICEDPNGSVWLYTFDGQLARYTNGRVVVGPADKYPSTYRSVVMEKSGLLWVGADHVMAGLNVTAGSNSLVVATEALNQLQKLDFLLASERGGYWRLADGRIQKWSRNHMTRDFGPYPWQRNVIASAACEDSQGNLIIGTSGTSGNSGEGVFWFDEDGHYARISQEQGLSPDNILSLTTDREGSLWVGTDGGGLKRVKRQFFDVVEQSMGAVVQTVCDDGKGGLWIGYNANKLQHWKNDAMHEFGSENGLVNCIVRSVCIGADEKLLVGTYARGLLELKGDTFREVPGFRASLVVWVVYRDRKGRIWAGTQNGLACQNEDHTWRVWTKADGLSAEAVRAIADDADGNLWIGTDGGGLDCLRDEKITVFHKEDGLPGDDISALYVDAEGVLWVGTTGNGLGRFHQGKWTHYTTAKGGLISNNIDYVIEDGQTNLWIGSNFGLMRVPKRDLNDFAQGLTNTLAYQTYGTAEGLPTTECTGGSQPAACRTQDARIWCPTIKGLVSVKPDELKLNTNPPPVVIESVSIGGHSITANGFRAALPKSVFVPPGTSLLEFRYTSLNLGDPDCNKARFKYRLEEKNETPGPFVDAGNSRFMRFPKLPPGSYRFQVIACNQDGAWNTSGASMAFVVGPFFWQTRLFRGAMVLVLLACVIGMVHYFSTQRLQRQLEGLRQQQALEKERQRIARDIHDQLGASLTQVSMLGELVESDKDSPVEVEAHARQISETARDTARGLDEIVWAVNPSNDTLEGLINYFCKYAQEYLSVAGLRYRLDVPDQLPKTPIPPDVRHNVFLASKEAVTNIVRHAKASSAWIRLRLEPSQFVLEIEDDGQGMAKMDQERARTRNGLSNMRKRLEQIGGSFTISTGSAGGTVVRLSAPLGKAKFDGTAKAV